MRRFAAWLSLLATALLVAAGLLGAQTAAAAHGTLRYYPDWKSGNAQRECASIGYPYGTKVENARDGTYGLDQGYGSLTLDWNDARNSLDWSATLGIDAVILKAGRGANVYSYNPEATGDTGLQTPEGKTISHVTFCYDFEVSVSKTANTSLTRTYSWSIDKGPEGSYQLFTGDSAAHRYTVAVKKDGYTDSKWAVSGEITIENKTPFPANITGVSDSISGIGPVAVSCPGGTAQTLSPGASLVCTYSTGLPDGSKRVNTATVTTSGAVGGGSAQADVDFAKARITEVNAKITVDDTNGSSWPFSDSGSVSYTRTFSCDQDNGSHTNVATIRETGQSDSARVTVRCYKLSVEKTAKAAFTRIWSWKIAKSGDQSSLTLSPGQQGTVNYSVVVSATKLDRAYRVSGQITISNPNPSRDATLTQVIDSYAGKNATVSCPALTVPKGGALICTYSVSLDGPVNGTNTATATQQNYSYDADGKPTAAGTTSYSGSRAVTFGGPTREIDACINVSDDKYGSLGTVCASQLPKSFKYALKVGPYNSCGTQEFVNTASFITNDTQATGKSSWKVTVELPCGCTLTQGYWKTHSREGPAPYDPAWQNIGPQEEDTPFFKSGKTWYQAFHTAPQGDAYYILAHQYMAAKLNVLNGADPSAVAGELAQAEKYFSGQLSLSSDQILALADKLDRYNKGEIGPGHCKS